MTFWRLTNSGFLTDQTFHQFHDFYTELDLHRIIGGFHGTFATGVASQQGTLTLPDTWFRPPFWDLLVLQLFRPDSSNLPCLYSTFHLEYPLVLSRFCSVLWQKPSHPQKNKRNKNVKKQKWHQKLRLQTITERLRMVSLSNNSHQTVVVKPVNETPTLPITSTVV